VESQNSPVRPLCNGDRGVPVDDTGADELADDPEEIDISREIRPERDWTYL
jgi:hypothetical protein